MEHMEQPIDTDSKMELEVLQAPWWAVLLEEIIAIVIGLFLLYEPVVTTILLIQYFTNWIEKSFSFIPISKYFSIKCLKS